jgi:hypothetical protein
MKLDNLDRAFARIGARVKFGTRTDRHAAGSPAVREDEAGAFYLLDLDFARQDRYDALDVQARRRALLLVGRDDWETTHYLCRHDGKRWIVDSLGGKRPTSVAAALARPSTPPSVPRIPIRVLHGGQVRQGRWIFVPRYDFLTTAEVAHREQLPVHKCRKLGFVAEYECRVGPSEVQLPHRPQGLYVRGWVWQPDQPIITLRFWHQAFRA